MKLKDEIKERLNDGERQAFYTELMKVGEIGVKKLLHLWRRKKMNFPFRSENPC